MKKLFILTTMLITLSCVKPVETVKEERDIIYNTSIYTLNESNGHVYKVYSQYRGGISVVNLTKDSLEAEYYKSQIQFNNKFHDY